MLCPMKIIIAEFTNNAKIIAINLSLISPKHSHSVIRTLINIHIIRLSHLIKHNINYYLIIHIENDDFESIFAKSLIL